MKFQLILLSSMANKTLEFNSSRTVWIRYNEAGALLIDYHSLGRKVAKIFLNKGKIYLKPCFPKLRCNGKKIEKKYIALQTGDQLSVEVNQIEFRLISSTESSLEKKNKKGEKEKKSAPIESKKHKKIKSSSKTKTPASGASLTDSSGIIEELETIPMYDNPIASSEATLVLPDLEMLESSIEKRVSPGIDLPSSRSQKTAKLQKIDKERPLLKIKLPEISADPEKEPILESEKEPVVAKKIFRTATIRKVKAEISSILPDPEPSEALNETMSEKEKQPKVEKIEKVEKKIDPKWEKEKTSPQKKEALSSQKDSSSEEESVSGKKKTKKKEAPLSLFSDTELKSQEAAAITKGMKLPSEISDSQLASDIFPDSEDQTISPVADLFAESENEGIEALMVESAELEASLKDEFGDQIPEAGSAEDILASSVFHEKSDFHQEVHPEDPLSSTQPQMDSSSDQALLLTQGVNLGSPKKFHSDESIKGNLFSAPPGETNIRKEVIRFSDLLSPSNLITTKNFKKDIF
ncbi:MAG: hypothetical protein AABZ60_00355 [Planctomycetota bacterium]